MHRVPYYLHKQIIASIFLTIGYSRSARRGPPCLPAGRQVRCACPRLACPDASVVGGLLRCKVTAGTANHGEPAYRQAGTAGSNSKHSFVWRDSWKCKSKITILTLSCYSYFVGSIAIVRPLRVVLMGGVMVATNS